MQGRVSRQRENREHKVRLFREEDLVPVRVLIDTNVLIGLEDPEKPVSKQLAKLLRIGIQNGCQFLAHPAFKQDLMRDRDEKRREIVLSKSTKYPILETPPVPDASFLSSIGSSPQPNVDDHLLYAVYKNCVHLLVTEDKGIHKKARRIGISSQVYSVSECLEAFENLFEKPTPPPSVQDVPVYTLGPKKPIFDSLRPYYPEFDEWFQKIAQEGRRAWVVVGEEGELEGICIYKEESGREEGICEGPVLKLCTFKVSEDARGAKIGELLLKTAFQYVAKRGLRGTYFTVFRRSSHYGQLVGFCEDFGFVPIGCTLRGESILFKSLVPDDTAENLSALEYHIRFYPHFLKGPSVKKFLVPVSPRYHRLLFPEAQQRIQPELWPSRLSASNAIRKAYICKSGLKSLMPGDLLAFYRSDDIQAVTNIGIVEKAVRATSAGEILSLVGKRTVYSAQEINDCYLDGGLVILFREAGLLEPFKELKRLGLYPPQSIRPISHQLFESLL